MFLLIGKELVKMQENSSYDSEAARAWKYTQNWIAYEIGLACQRGIDVWVLCDSVPINFPVPYFNHYQPFAGDLDWLKLILDAYAKAGRLSPANDIRVQCPSSHCGVEFHFWAYHYPRPFEVPCPQCLTVIKFG